MRRLSGLTVLAVLSLVGTTIFPDGYRDQPVGAVAYAADSGPALINDATWSDTGPEAEDPSEIAAVISGGKRDEATPSNGKGRGRSGTKSTTTTNSPGTTANSDSTTSTTELASSSTTTTTTTQATTSTTEPGSEPVSSGTITGNACPCEVTGTVELKGQINLQGDLVVMGGTLLADDVVITGNGYQVMVMNGGVLDWDGFTADNVLRIMFMDGAGPSTLRNGLVTNSGGPKLGEYPLHWHLNGDSTRGTVVANVTVRNSPNRAFVPHGSHGITFSSIRAENITGSAFWWDDPGTNEDCSFRKFCRLDNSNDIVVNGLVVKGVYRFPGDPGYRLAGVTLGAGTGNVMRNATVSGVHGKKDCSAFTWPEAAGGNAGIWVFENNHGTSDCHGIFVWQNDSKLHIISGFTGGGIKQGAYVNAYEYRDVNVPYLLVVATGASFKDSHFDKAVMIAGQSPETGFVTFNNVTFGTFEVNDAHKKSGAHYVVEGTNISCSDVVWTNPHPLSTVTIDGVSCDRPS